MDSTYDSTYPRGCILVIDKNDISTVLTTSIKMAQTLGTWVVKVYDFDVSNDSELVLSLVSIGETTGTTGMAWGMSGDGHHNEIYKHAISELNGSLT